MREGLSTCPCARWAGSLLLGQQFSEADDCAILVKFCDIMKNNHLFGQGVKVLHLSLLDFLRLGAKFFAEA
ncbi:hypothetical protein EEB11_01890 [Pseudotabrizicola sediminis]|uniref:Uncharacterized protein n=1 Tax=Pseudotabrizicola sediminis TaxID=2486418 RepID=A0ABY2KUV0_9RHOB|nr:hypothetical protein EEB11_01890 [Pseudotabrizicola sediminis]